MNHTAFNLPVRVVHDNENDETIIYDANDEYVAGIPRSLPNYVELAQFIVAAFNSHEAMKAALEQAQAALGDIVRDYPSDNDDFDELQEAYEATQQALLLAEGKEPAP